MDKSLFCCDAFAKEAGHLQAPAGGGFMYPPGMRPSAQFEPDIETGTWSINGCCGGGCYVVTEMRFCPFCGSDVSRPEAPASEGGGNG